MKLVQVAEQNKKFYTKDFIHGFNTGAKTQLEADKREAERRGCWVAVENDLDYYPFMCSECYETVIKRTNYCPGCGVKMEAKENEND